MQTNDGLAIDTAYGAVTFPTPTPAPLVLPADQTPAPRDNGNQLVLIGSLTVVMMILAWVGLRSHNE